MANFTYNKVIEGGRLAADPELKVMTNGDVVTDFTVAVSKRGKAGEDGGANYFRCVAYKKTAEFITRFFRKGMSICVEGALNTRRYTDKAGVVQYVTEILVREAFFVDAKGEGVGTLDPGAGEGNGRIPSEWDGGGIETADYRDDGELPF